MPEELGTLKIKIETDDKELGKGFKKIESEARKHEQKVSRLLKKGYTKQNAEFAIALKKRQKDLKKERQQELFIIKKAQDKKLISVRQAAKARIKIEKQFNRELLKIQKGKAFKEPDLAGSLIKAGAGAIAVVSLAKKFISLAKAADVANNRISAMASIVGAKLGEQAIPKAIKLLDELSETGLMERELVAESIKNMTAWGATIEQTTEFLKGQLDMAVKNRDGNYELGQSIVTVTRGLKNNNSELTDTTGISENLSVIVSKAKKIYKEQGKVFDDNAEKLAILNEFNKQGAVFAGDAAAAQEQFTGSMSRFNVEVKKTTVVIGTQIGEVLQPIITILANLISSFSEWFNTLSKTSKAILIFSTILVPLVPTIWGLVAALRALAIAGHLALGPLGWIVLALGALVTAAFAVSEGFKDNRTEGEKLADTYKNLNENQEKTIKQTKQLEKLNLKLDRAIKDLTKSGIKFNDTLENREKLLGRLIDLENLSGMQRIVKLASDKPFLERQLKELEALQTTIKLLKRLDDVSGKRSKKARAESRELQSELLLLNKEFGDALKSSKIFDEEQLKTSIESKKAEIIINDQLFQQEKDLLEAVKKRKPVGPGAPGPGPTPAKQIKESQLALNEFQKEQLSRTRELTEAEKFYNMSIKQRENLTDAQLEQYEKLISQQEKITGLTRKELRERFRLNSAIIESVSVSERIGEGAEQLLETLHTINEKEILKTISGLGKIATILGSSYGIIISSIANTFSKIKNLVIGIGDILKSWLGSGKSLKQIEEKRIKDLEIEKDLLEKQLDQLELQSDVSKSILEIQKEKISLIELELGLRKQIIATFAAGNVQEAKDVKKITEAAFEASGGHPKLLTEVGQQKAAARIIEGKTQIAALRTIRDLLAKIPSGTDPASNTARKDAIDTIKSVAESAGLEGHNLVRFALSEIEKIDKVSKRPDLKGLTPLQAATAENAQTVKLKKQLKESVKLFQTLSERLNIPIVQLKGKVTTLETQAQLGRGVISATKQLTQAEETEFIDELRDEVADVERTLGITEDPIEQQKLLSELVRTLKTEIDFTGNLEKLINEINNEDEGFKKEQLQILKTSIEQRNELITSNEEIADNTLNTLLKLDPDKQINLLDIAVQSIRSAGQILPTAINVQLPQAINNIGRILASAKQDGTETQFSILKKSEEHLLDIKTLLAILVELEQDNSINSTGDIELFIDGIINNLEDRKVA